MANITTYLENKLLEHATGKSSWTMPSSTKAALFTTSPTAAYTAASPDGTEVTGSGYSRQVITWGSAASGQIKNSAAISWTAGGEWSTGNKITTIGIFEASTDNLLWFGPISASITMENTDTFNIPVGYLTLMIS